MQQSWAGRATQKLYLDGNRVAAGEEKLLL